MSRVVSFSARYPVRLSTPTARIYDDRSEYFFDEKPLLDRNVIDYNKKILPVELDIFSSLPDYVYNNPDANYFLKVLRKKLFQYDRSELDGITLTKLQVTEHTESIIILEWIFNYFRVFFGFDANEGDFYGEIMNNVESGEFHNDMHVMKREEFEDVAEANLAYVVMMARG